MLMLTFASLGAEPRFEYPEAMTVYDTKQVRIQVAPPRTLLIEAPKGRVVYRGDRDDVGVGAYMVSIHREDEPGAFPRAAPGDLLIRLEAKKETLLGPFAPDTGFAIDRALRHAQADLLFASPEFSIYGLPLEELLIVDETLMGSAANVDLLTLTRVEAKPWDASRRGFGSRANEVFASRKLEGASTLVFESRGELPFLFGPIRQPLAEKLAARITAWMARRPIPDGVVTVTEAALSERPRDFHRRRVQVEGVWRRGYEHSEFADAWLDASLVPGGRQMQERSSARRVRITGVWIAPVSGGRFGHRGAFGQKLLAESIEDLEGDGGR